MDIRSGRHFVNGVIHGQIGYYTNTGRVADEKVL
jgi:hypothetical protein